MSLPKINVALYDLQIPSTKTPIKVRQMQAKEEKILLMAKADSNPDLAILSAIKQVINNVIVTPPNLKIETLAMFDLEYLFIKVRALSVSNKIKVSWNDSEEYADFEKAKADPALDAKTQIEPPVPYTFEINLDDVSVKFPDTEKEINVDGRLTIVMKYPDLQLYSNKAFLELKNDPWKIVDYLLQNCIEYIEDGNHKHYPLNSSVEELKEFLESLPLGVYEKLKLYLNNLPTIYLEFKYTNKKDHERKIVLNTLSDFFTF